MGETRAKAQAVLLAAFILMSCLAVSSSNCIPRRLLPVSRSYYQRPPCNDDIDRPKLRGRGGGDDGKEEPSGSRIPGGPPSPTGGRSRAAAAPPGSNN